VSEEYTDENIAMLDQQISLMLGDSVDLHDVISKASEAKMLGLAEAAIYKAVHGDFVASPSPAGRRFFSDEDHNEWREAQPPERVAQPEALVTIELQHLIKELCCESSRSKPDDPS